MNPLRFHPAIALAALLLAALFATVALAGEEPACTDGLVPAGAYLKLPAFLFDQTVTVAGSAPDAFIWAQYVEIPGEVRDNAFLGGQKINIDGVIGGDLFAFAQTLTITGEVGGDVWAWGGEINVMPGARVRGNIYSGCGVIEIKGEVDGHLGGGCGTVRIDGVLGDGGDIGAGTLRIGPTAVIRGELIYASAEPAVVDPAATIEGELVFKEVLPSGGDDGTAADDGGYSFWPLIKSAWFYAAGLIVGAILLALARTHMLRPSALLNRQPGKVLGVGFIALVVVPIGAIVAMLLVLTLPLGLIGLALYMVAFYLAQLVSSLWLGAKLLALLGKGFGLSFGALALGLLVFQGLGFIPYLGFLVKWLAVVAGLGAITLVLMNRDRREPAVA